MSAFVRKLITVLRYIISSLPADFLWRDIFVVLFFMTSKLLSKKEIKKKNLGIYANAMQGMRRYFCASKLVSSN